MPYIKWQRIIPHFLILHISISTTTTNKALSSSLSTSRTIMMELSSAQQHLHQEMATDSLENMLICTKAQQDRKPRPQQEQALKCPRCDSTNTKFCYYNNYSLTQPRYFCKSCRRYWTNGGTLRNVPVGGGCRKNKRPSSSKRSSTSNSDHHHLLLNSSSSSDHHTTLNNNPLSTFSSQMSSYDNNDQYHHQPCSDLSLVFARLQKQASCGDGYDQFDHHPNHAHEHNNNLPLNYSNGNSHFGNLMGLNNISAGGGHHGFLEGLKANLLEQTQLQNNSSSFQNLYNGGFGSNGSNISGDQIMTIPYEDLGISSSFDTSKTTGLLLKQEDNNIHQLKYDQNHNVPRSQILWGGAAGFPWHQINANNSINGHEVDHSNSNRYNMVDNADLMRENMNVFASAAPVWQGLINSPLM